MKTFKGAVKQTFDELKDLREALLPKDVKIIDYKGCVEELEKLATSWVNCSHEFCSISEAIHEENFGRRILNIIKKYKKKND